MSNERSIAVLGDINVDLSFALRQFPQPGGDTPATGLHWGSGGAALNMAVALAQLQARPRLIGRVGDDPAAGVALRAAGAAGVDLSAIQHDATVPTGLCGVIVEPGGQRSFLSFRGANAHYDPARIEAALAGCAMLLVGGHALLAGAQRQSALRAIDLAVARGLPVALDLCIPLIESDRDLVWSLLRRVRLLTLNEAELALLADGRAVAPALDMLCREGAATVAIKRGAAGCSVGHADMRLHCAPPAVAAVDTTGCGDAFSAGFAWALLRGAPLADCAALGNLLGALTAERPGAADAVPAHAAIRARADLALAWLIG